MKRTLLTVATNFYSTRQCVQLFYIFLHDLQKGADAFEKTKKFCVFNFLHTISFFLLHEDVKRFSL